MKFEIMDHTGHSTVEFDKANKAEVERAMKTFARLVGNGKMLAATREAGDKDYTVVRDFEDLKAETLFVPQMRGG